MVKVGLSLKQENWEYIKQEVLKNNNYRNRSHLVDQIIQNHIKKTKTLKEVEETKK